MSLVKVAGAATDLATVVRQLTDFCEPSRLDFRVSPVARIPPESGVRHCDERAGAIMLEWYGEPGRAARPPVVIHRRNRGTG